MKKVLALVLSFAVCLTLTACKSKAVKEVEGLIAQIGEVALESKDIINEAKGKYDALTEEQQGEVENVDVLDEAIKQYDQLVEEQRKQKIEENYCKILQWIADNGEPTYSDNVNSYGQVDKYSYEDYSFFTWGGKVDAICRLCIKGTEDKGSETIASVYISQYIDRSLWIDVKDDSLEYTWKAKAWVFGLSSSDEIKEPAYGEISVDISEFSTQKTDYLIRSYKATDGFKNAYGIDDARTKINTDMQNDIKKFADFIEKEIGLTLKDIGFDQCS